MESILRSGRSAQVSRSDRPPKDSIIPQSSLSVEPPYLDRFYGILGDGGNRISIDERIRP